MNVTLVLSGYITDGGGMAGCVMLKACRIITKENVKSSIEETNSCRTQHLIEAAKCESQRVAVISNDTDVALYCLTYENMCWFYGYKEVLVRFGAGEKPRDIPIHVLANKLEDHLLYPIILKTHALTGCDVTSKIETKSSAMKNNLERFLEDFGIVESSDAAFKSAEHYLVNVI